MPSLFPVVISITLPGVSTIADGTAVKTPGEKIFPYIQENLDGIITVEDARQGDDFPCLKGGLQAVCPGGLYPYYFNLRV